MTGVPLADMPLTKSADGLWVVPVYAERANSGQWTLKFAVNCPFCNRKHQHGGGRDDGPYVAGVWGAHCSSEHKAFRPDCKPVRTKGMPTRCHVEHGTTYELILVTKPPLLTEQTRIGRSKADKS